MNPHCRKIWLFWLFSCLSGVLYSQTVSESTVRSLYDQLVVAVGNVHPRAPKLVFKNSTRNPASFNPITHEISLENKVLGICHSFGSDSLEALAYILSHELAHSYCEHGWQTKFAGLDFSNAMDSKLESTEQRIDDETEADLKAGFYSHLAGYDALSIADDFLVRVYRAYDLPDSIPGYPSLNNRIEIIKANKSRFDKLKRIYDSAIRCFVLGQYDYATRLFDQIIAEGFTSREVYNNLGLCLVYRALDFDAEELGGGLLYPFELDLNTRLNVQASTRGNSDLSTAISFLEDAEIEFKTALRLSPNYAEAKSNLFFTQLLLRSGLGAKINLRFDQDEIIACGSSCSNCVNGLFLASEGNKKKSERLFKRGASEGCQICSVNASSRKPNGDNTEFAESLFEYNGIDIYCKDFTKSDCDVYASAARRFDLCHLQSTGFSQTMIKTKDRGSRRCITLIEITEGALERLPEVKIGLNETDLPTALGDYEIFRAGAADFYMSKEKAVAYEVSNGVISRGLYFERID